MQVQEIMTTAVQCCTPEDSARKAAELMREADSGVIPVLRSAEDPLVIGIVTDRDLCMSVIAEGRDPNAVPVSECMTNEVVSCKVEDDVERAADLMAEKQIRRLPVVDDRGAIFGIISLADIAQSQEDDSEVAGALHDISESTPEASIPRSSAKDGD
jgi:CBS domain-containing protein